MGQPQASLPHSRALGSPTRTAQNHDPVAKKHKWYYYLWDTLDKPKEERWFMFKLDAALLTFASLGKTAQ
jgi:MFS transporter, ACS family, pantothenate transporter